MAATLARFVVELAELAGWAVPREVHTLDTINEWAIPDELKARISRDWPKVKAWWTSCLSADQRQAVNKATQAWMDPGGILGSGIGAGVVAGVTDPLKALVDPHNWLRVGMAIAGGAMFLAGLAALGAAFGGTQAGREAGQVRAVVLRSPVGRAGRRATAPVRRRAEATAKVAATREGFKREAALVSAENRQTNRARRIARAKDAVSPRARRELGRAAAASTAMPGGFVRTGPVSITRESEAGRRRRVARDLLDKGKAS